jgi:glycosyltransferase involved in cell wall biosynthesis
LLLPAIYPRLDKVVFVNRQAAASTQGIVRLDASRIEVIPNSLDPDTIEERQRAGHSWNPPPGAMPIVMAVGRLNPEKGFDLLIRAHRRLRDAGVDHLLVILGKGPLREALAALAQQLNVSNSVIMPGYFANPYDAMKKAAVFALSSHVEGFPSVLMEALYLGIPIVATRCRSGPAEILDNDRYGLLVPPNDEIALSEAIGTLLNDPARRSQMSEAGRNRIKAFYAGSIVNHWQSMFAEVLGQRTKINSDSR